MPATVTGTGAAVPPNVVANDDLTRIMGTTDEWIRSRTGVVTRRFVDRSTEPRIWPQRRPGPRWRTPPCTAAMWTRWCAPP